MQQGTMHSCSTMHHMHYSTIMQCPAIPIHDMCLRGTWVMHSAKHAEASRGSVKCKYYRKQAPCLASYCTSTNRLTALLPNKPQTTRPGPTRAQPAKENRTEQQTRRGTQSGQHPIGHWPWRQTTSYALPTSEALTTPNTHDTPDCAKHPSP